MTMVSKFIFNFCNFSVVVCFLTKLLTSGILFSRVINSVFIAKLLILGILPSISVILVLQSVFLTKPLVSGIFFSNSVLSKLYLVFHTKSLVSILFTSATNLSHTVFFETSFFTTSLSLLKSTGTGANLSMSNLSTSAFGLAKLVFSAKIEVSTCVSFFKSVFIISLSCHEQVSLSGLTKSEPTRQIKFNVYISSKASKRFRKVLTHFYMRSFIYKISFKKFHLEN